MSLHGGTQKTNFGLVAGCVSFVTVSPVAGIVACCIGGNYDARLSHFICVFLWGALGSLVVTWICWKNESMKAKDLLLWVTSTWLWPIPLLMKIRRLF